ncbi:MAG: PSD1 and planctomycete cytochrome C domain-containing protein [Acidobacteriota bacterium]
MLFRLGALAGALIVTASAQDAGVDHFEKKVRPVLAAHCYACHSASVPAPQGGLRLDSSQGIKRGGNSGVLIQPGDPEHSLLMRAIRYTEKNLKMPPSGPLPPEVVTEFEVWIRSGAALPSESVRAEPKQPELWSLKKPALPPLPAVKNQSWVRNDIDRFVLSRLEAGGLVPSTEADKRTLIRRATYDLTGLPPTAAEVQQFLKDRSPQAYERLIDRLLASPHYGERWGRHWLDVARYSDCVNDSVNSGQRYPWSYTYRDWVIGALNEDLPYDRFILYQLAADRLPKAEPRHLAALGFLSLGRDFPNSYPETVDDRIDAVSRGLLGLTVACARCHDHKYDPIPTKDYYSLYSILSNIREPQQLPVLTQVGKLSPKQAVYQQRLDRIQEVYQEYRMRRHAEMVSFFKTQTAEYLVAARDAEGLSNPEIEELVRDRQLNQHLLARWGQYLRQSKAANEPVFRLWHAAAAIPDKEFEARWPETRQTITGSVLIEAEVEAKPVRSLRDLAAAYAGILAKHDRTEPFAEPEANLLREVVRGSQSPVEVPPQDFDQICTEGDRNNMRSIRVRYNRMLAQSAYDGAPPRAMAVEDLPRPVAAHVFIRGNPNNPGALAPPRFLSCLNGSDEPVFHDGSGRLELAQAIVDPENPLTARVMVNRVWMHHFGLGLVRTPSDFGVRGDPPTHPELFDYLAVRFVESGWSLKKLHRLIMTSAAYRQASSDNEAGRKIDPDNRLLWRMNRKRLEIESLRDSILRAAGRLDLGLGGLPFSLTAEPSVPRRSVYGFIERGRLPGLLNAFDFASPDQHAPQRYVTTVPQQALFFLNSSFVAEQARAIVVRPEVAGALTASDKIRRLYEAILAREPEKGELEASLKFVLTEERSSAEPASDSVWQYGVGEYRAETGSVESFTPFTVFVSDGWQGGSVLPAGPGGKAMIHGAGGEPGERPDQAVVRSWRSPVSGILTIEGTLRHTQPAVPYGDGVRARIVSSRRGELASWWVNGSSADTGLSGIKVEKNETISFVVDARLDPENDAFTWAPIIKCNEQRWSAKNDFAGPPAAPLGVWARYAQVLLETNEFAFVD